MRSVCAFWALRAVLEPAGILAVLVAVQMMTRARRGAAIAKSAANVRRLPALVPSQSLRRLASGKYRVRPQ